MRNTSGKARVILTVILATILFSFFRRLDAFFSLMNTLADRGWSLLPIILTSVPLRMVSSGFAVLWVLPVCLGYKKRRKLFAGYLRIDRKIVTLGVLSFGIFGGLATAISLGMGIFRGDLSAVFAFPDLRPDPDTVGWGYFVLALVPGIWEELAFRGLIQSKVRTVFSTPASILFSSLFFGLFHFTNLLNQAPSLAFSGVIMSFLFGLGWGYMTVKARSVVPAMISHYLVDSMGQIFLSVENSDPALASGFFMLLTLAFPIGNILLAKVLYRSEIVDMHASRKLEYSA